MQCKENIGGIEPRSIFFESTDLGQVEEQFTTRAIFENKEKFAFTLKGIVHFYNEWMSSIFKNSPLRHCVLNLVPLDQISLFEDFESV